LSCYYEPNSGHGRNIVIVQTIDCLSESAGQELTVSLHDTGFAVLRNHPIPNALLDSLYVKWMAFFKGDEKDRFRTDPDTNGGTQAGYFPPTVSETAVGHSTKDLKEFFHAVPGSPMPSGCADDTLQYHESAYRLGSHLLGLVQRHTPQDVIESLSEPLAGMLSREASLLRILHYPPLDGTENPEALRAAAHEDINLITVLPVSDQAGLQVQDTGGRWIDVSSQRGDIIINSGDMLQEASSGYFPSTTHRVDNPGAGIDNVSRISIPFFLTPRLDVVLSERYTSGSYLDERLRLISR
jgi:isopenicillin N synthase-like dioxygenase